MFTRTVLKYRMSVRSASALSVAVLLWLSDAPANLARAQTDAAEYVRQSDVIYGHKFGVALTMEILTPAKRNGLGVVWVVSSSGKSSRELTLQPSFERRVLPLLRHGYAVFAVVHGSAPVFQVQ